MAVEDKAAYYSEDLTKSFRLYTSDMNYLKDQVNYWRIHVLEDNIQSWPKSQQDIGRKKS